MEEAFSLLYVAKDFPEIYNRGKGRRSVAGERKEIADFFHILFPVLTTLDRKIENNGYDALANALTDGDAIITLNYDTMLDSALHRKGWDPKKGYAIKGNVKKKISWGALPEVTPSLNVKLLKLHGSMNWFVKGEMKALKKVFASKPVKITPPRQNEISGHIRQIVPPLYGKIFEHTHWQTLWTDAFRLLCDAEVFVVVGCSLIDTDFHLRALFSQVARTRKRDDKRFRILMLADKTRVRRKWQLVLKGSFEKNKQYSSFKKLVSTIG
jgi:SIR2-like domain